MDSQNDLNSNTPVMSEGTSKDAGESPAQQSGEVVFSNGATQKSGKLPVVLVTIVAVIMTAAAAAFAYLYFTNLPSGSENSGDSGSGQSSENQGGSSKKGGSSKSGGGSENTGRSEADIIKELKEKVGIILGKIGDDDTITIGRSIVTHDVTLFTEGTMPAMTNIAHILQSSMVSPIELTDVQISTILGKVEKSEEMWKKHLEENRDSVAFSVDDVADAYYSVFGNEIENRDVTTVCPPYYYDSELSIYYQMWPGCGGTTAYNRQYYVHDYEVSGDSAYVYIVAASSNGENNLYCDVYKSLESVEPCGTVTDLTDLVNSSNYEDFAEYRFVFNKADDGTYYFVKVEKL